MVLEYDMIMQNITKSKKLCKKLLTTEEKSGRILKLSRRETSSESQSEAKEREAKSERSSREELEMSLEQGKRF